LRLKNIFFKSKNCFWAKTSFLSFCQKYVLANFKLFFLILKVLLIFSPNEYIYFFQTDFFIHNLKEPRQSGFDGEKKISREFGKGSDLKGGLSH
jgi:hypothetical protein